MSDSIRVLIADDHALLRASFRLLVDSSPDMQVVSEADNGMDAVLQAKRTRPDVILMDVRMPHLDGIAATRQICGDPELNTTRVLILTLFDLDEYVYAALKAGASGFLLKDARPTDLLNGIQVIAAGESLLAPSVTRRLIAEFARRPAPAQAQQALLSELTARETEVLLLIARGQNNFEIAESLQIGLGTVKTHVTRVLQKLQVRDRAQLVAVAYETGLIVASAPSF